MYVCISCVLSLVVALVWSGLLVLSLSGFSLSDGRDWTREKTQQLLLVSSSSTSCVIRWQCERRASGRGEDKPDGEKRDTGTTSTEVEGGRKEREMAGGCEGNGYYGNRFLSQFLLLNIGLSLSLPLCAVTCSCASPGAVCV